jgi:hypothetical protein
MEICKIHCIFQPRTFHSEQIIQLQVTFGLRLSLVEMALQAYPIPPPNSNGPKYESGNQFFAKSQ